MRLEQRRLVVAQLLDHAGVGLGHRVQELGEGLFGFGRHPPPAPRASDHRDGIEARPCGLATVALPMRAPRPAAGPALALFELLAGPANAALSGRLLLRILDPADELVAGQRRDVPPGIERRGVGDQLRAQVRGKLVHHSTGQSRIAHSATVASWGEALILPVCARRIAGEPRGQRIRMEDRSLLATTNLPRNGCLQQGPRWCAQSAAEQETYGIRRGGVWPSMRW